MRQWLHALLARAELPWLLLAAGMVGLNWPVLDILAQNPGRPVFFWYLFGLWAVVIVLLFCMRRGPDEDGN